MFVFFDGVEDRVDYSELLSPPIKNNVSSVFAARWYFIIIIVYIYKALNSKIPVSAVKVF